MLKNKFPWKVISSKKVYKNNWLSLREDKIVRPCGKKGIYGVVEISPAVGIIPVTKSGKIILLETWRYPSRKKSIEIPLGGVDKGETLLQAAKRELLEETGLEAKKWKYLGTFDVSVSMTTDKSELFLAKDLYLSKNQDFMTEKDDGIIKTIEISLEKAITLIRLNKITEATTKGGLLLLKLIQDSLSKQKKTTQKY